MTRKEFEALLIDLNRALRVFSFYPLSHPVTTQLSEELYKKIDSLIKKYDKVIEIEVTRNSFISGEEIIENHPTLSSIAYEFFKRRIKKFFILPGVTPQEVKSFLLAISSDLDSIEKSGGVDKILIQYKVQNIWINEIDFTLRKELKEQGPPINFNTIMSTPKAVSEESKELQKILNSLQEHIGKPTFKTLLKRIRNLCIPMSENKEWYQLLSALEVLSHIASSPYTPDADKELARKTILSIVNKDVLDFLISEYLGAPPIKAREIIIIFQQLGKISFPFLLKELIENEDKTERRKLIQLASKMGKPILDYLYKLLDDQRWYILRNILLIIGEIEDPESLPYIEDFLEHPDIRVRKEAIRAFTKISQEKGLEKLGKLYKTSNKEVKSVIINSLKLIKSVSVTQFTLDLYRKEKNKELKALIINNLPFLTEKDKIIPVITDEVMKNISKLSGKPNEVALAGIQALSKMGNRGIEALNNISGKKGKLKSIISETLKNEKSVRRTS